MPSWGSRRITFSWIGSPSFTKSLGRVTWPQLMSLMCSRPSKPPRSTKAPKEVKLLTVPSTTSPILIFAKNSSRRFLMSSSIQSRRETTMLVLPLA